MRLECPHENPENAEQARRMGKWMDKRSPLLQCRHRVLVGWGTPASDLLDCTGCCWSGGHRPL